VLRLSFGGGEARESGCRDGIENSGEVRTIVSFVSSLSTIVRLELVEMLLYDCEREARDVVNFGLAMQALCGLLAL
jgi:hypothetical protein